MRASVFLLGCVYPRGILRGKRGLTWRCAPAIARFAIASTRLPLTRGCVRRTIAATWSGVSALMGAVQITALVCRHRLHSSLNVGHAVDLLALLIRCLRYSACCGLRYHVG